MKPEIFKAWQEEMGWSVLETAKRLGKDRDTISSYRVNGVPKAQAQVVGLAMAALEQRLAPIA